MFKKIIKKGFQILFLHHAEAILTHDLGSAASEIENILDGFKINVEELIYGGGGEANLTQRLRKEFSQVYSWEKHVFEIKKIVDGEEKESISHEIDHVKKFGKYTFALELEWNNKDPFFDRDLENFKRLHADGVISIGGIITRGTTFQDNIKDIMEEYALLNEIKTFDDLLRYYTPTARQKDLINSSVKKNNSFAKGWAHAFIMDKYGEATTHWRKLEDRVRRGVGNPCPLLLIGIPSNIIEI